VAKKRTPPRKSSSAKRVKKASRPARKTATKRATPAGGVDFRPVKAQIRAHIAKLEKRLGGPEARAAAADPKEYETLDQLRALNQQLTTFCFPSMVINS
jgi:hypothetical protein